MEHDMDHDEPEQGHEPVFVSQGPLARLRELQRLLAGEGIASEVVHPPGENTNT